MSIHPTTTNEEVDFICKSIIALATNFKDWEKDYQYNETSNEFIYKGFESNEKMLVESWFNK